MKILIIEATAEELMANRTVMDSVNDVLNKFTGSLFGVTGLDFSKAFSTADDSEEDEPDGQQEEQGE